MSILDESKDFNTRYQWVDDFNSRQLDVFWRAEDYNAADDLHDYRTLLNDQERQMLLNMLSIFTHYEIAIGGDFWGGYFQNTFKGREFQRTAATFAMQEGIHEVFYNQINKALGMQDEDFYNEVFVNKVLSSKMDNIAQSFKGSPSEVLVSMTFLEGVSLFSSFAAIKSFRKPGGINAMKNTVSGISHSVVDESLHSEFTAACYVALGQRLTDQQVQDIAIEVVNIEFNMLDYITGGKDTRSFSIHDMRQFIVHRADECVKMLGHPNIATGGTNSEVAKWFYTGAKSAHVNDFFQVGAKDYKKSCNAEQFIWNG